MKKIVIGILAHVDAGKTTLSESLLYLSGRIRKMGRVDNRDAYLDNYELEKQRGITIFSKQATFRIDETEITLLDTPGHVDFSTEMERTLQVLDYAILVISAADGVQGYTKTLWRLLTLYKIPVFIFVNKMDQIGANKENLMLELKKYFSDCCVDFSQTSKDSFYEQVAMCDDVLLEAYLEANRIENSQIKAAIKKRILFPCFFGSALKLKGVGALLQSLTKYTDMPYYPEEFGARVFKVGRDKQGNRLTYLKITGGKLKVKDVLTNGIWEEKINQIRLYSGEKFTLASEAEAGTVCAVTGLTQTKPGEVLGVEKKQYSPILEPVLNYRILLPEEFDPRMVLSKLRQLEEEDPQLQIVWDEQLNEIRVQVMGEMQIEILQSLIKRRFDIAVSFDEGEIVYKETIANVTEGVGHFETLGHYAEVHLLLEPSERGRGLQFLDGCSEDLLPKSAKETILSCLKEKHHKGVLTGAEITDMKITLVSGRVHHKHTANSDLREAAYRAVRQGLKEAESLLLEPYYTFQLELPAKMVGRAMTDIERMHGRCQISQLTDETAILIGEAPVATMRNYQRELTAYTKGHGKLFYSVVGYESCHNAKEVVARIGYDSEKDLENPTASVFYKNGNSFLVAWDEVKKYMHVESYFAPKNDFCELMPEKRAFAVERDMIGPEEVERIIQQTYFANQGEKTKKRKAADTVSPGRNSKTPTMQKRKEEFLLIDGYNIIFSWPELKELAQENLEAARAKLIDYLSKYQSVRNCQIIVVFDAYHVPGRHEEIIKYDDNLHLVYTKEEQEADHFIEKFTFANQENYNIIVATSDRLEQCITRGLGSAVLSAGELKREIDKANERLLRTYREKNTAMRRNILAEKLTAAKKQKE
ncbi:MAG: GTP-binding protein [Firmicutes bacterium]|nr:GTP-binding protein [Bacillota bacterium]